jgi:hypothetical protein
MLQKLLPIPRNSSPLEPHLRALLQHMLGAWPDDQGRMLWGRRNYFVTGPGQADDALQRLVAAGMVRVGSCAGNDVRHYHATEKGCLSIGLNALQARRAMDAATQYERQSDREVDGRRS